MRIKNITIMYVENVEEDVIDILFLYDKQKCDLFITFSLDHSLFM